MAQRRPGHSIQLYAVEFETHGYMIPTQSACVDCSESHRTLGTPARDMMVFLAMHSVIVSVLDGTINPKYGYNDDWCIVLLSDGRLAEVRRTVLARL